MPELTRNQLIATAAIVFAVVFVGARALSGQRAAQSRGFAGADTAAVTTTPPVPRVEDPALQPALVHVVGAVRAPGVYRLAAGARVNDAIRRAGGASARADLAQVNLAAKVADGQQIVVPRRGAAGAGTGAGAAPVGGGAPGADAAGAGTALPGGAPAAPVDLNTATLEQLDTLPGVGPATAQKILAYRTEHGGFRSIDELAQVPGIGPKKLAALRDAVRV